MTNPTSHSLVDRLCIAIEVLIGISMARALNLSCFWLFFPDLQPLPLSTWFVAYIVQDFFFWSNHAGTHGVGWLRHFKWVPRTLLPNHHLHHATKQSPLKIAHYFLLETTPFTALCSLIAFVVLGAAGAVSSVVQNIGSQHLIHWIHHTPWYTVNHHMRHHRYRVVNMGGENVLWDVLFGSYDGTVLFNLGPQIVAESRRKIEIECE
jgi:hypothetical protein